MSARRFASTHLRQVALLTYQDFLSPSRESAVGRSVIALFLNLYYVTAELNATKCLWARELKAKSSVDAVIPLFFCDPNVRIEILTEATLYGVIQDAKGAE